MAFRMMFLIFCVALAGVQAPGPPEVRSQEELAVMVFMRSLFARTHGDSAAARKYLPATLFTDDEVAKLVAISKDVAALAPAKQSEGKWDFPVVAASDSPPVSQDPSAPKRQIVLLVPVGPRLGDYVVARLGEDLYKKVRAHAVSLVKMKSVPQSPR